MVRRPATTGPALALAAAAVLGAGTLSGCSHHAAARDNSARAVVSSLGAVPIPTAPVGHPTATASVRHPTIVAMGEPVRATLPGGTEALVTALGPQELDPQPGNRSTPGVITVKVSVRRGRLPLSAKNFVSRDETGRLVPLRPQGAAAATITPARPSTLVIRGTYESGAAQLSWLQGGKVVAVWDFNIELD